MSTAVTDAAPDGADVVEPVLDSEGSLVTEVHGPEDSSSMELAADPAEAAVALDGGEAGLEMVLELPSVGLEKEPQVASDGTVIFPGGDANVDVGVQSLTDGAVRALTSINGAESPTRYVYGFEVGDGTLFVPTEDGGIHLMDAEGKLAGAILPAWAVDAAGTLVPTHYEIDGTTVTQVVDHLAGDFQYPVVADPKIYYAWWQIFSRTQYHYPKLYPGGQLSIALSGWGRWDVITAPGQFLNSGWNLLRKNYSSYVLTTSMKQQWDCHVLGGIAEWGTFDLERHRPSNTNWRSRIWTTWPLNRVCNW